MISNKWMKRSLLIVLLLCMAVSLQSFAFAGKNLPPGIAISTQAIKTSWYALKSKDYPAVESYMGLGSTRYQDYSFDIGNEPKNEPATYLILGMIPGTSPTYHAKRSDYGNLPAKDPMVDWASAIENYICAWTEIDKQEYNAQELKEFIEKPLLSAIFKSAGKSGDDVDSYLKMTVAEKEAYLKKVIMVGLKNPPDKTMVTLHGSVDGKQVYRSQLIAAWASFVLTRHFQRIEGRGKTTMLVFNNLEIPIAQKIGIKIRGPHHYGL